MSKEGVKLVISRMIMDPSFKRAVLRDAKKAVASAGIAVTAEEMAGLERLEAGDLKVTKAPGPGRVGRIVVSRVSV